MSAQHANSKRVQSLSPCTKLLSSCIKLLISCRTSCVNSTLASVKPDIQRWSLHYKTQSAKLLWFPFQGVFSGRPAVDVVSNVQVQLVAVVEKLHA